ncbi:MAG: 3-keto-disaccharide hydrolase [Fimbriiglobus sp.]
MQRWIVAAMIAVTSVASAAEPPKGFKAVFNGTDLTGWHGWEVHKKGATPPELAKLSKEEREAKLAPFTADAKKHWSVKDGVLVNDGHGAYLATDEEFGDVEFLIEYKTVPLADSGIYMKGAPQIQIWDSTEEKKFNIGADKGSGGLWNNSPGAKGKDPLVKADKPFGEWNSFRIIQVGEYTTIYLNGKLVVDHARLENYYDRKMPLLKNGSVVLQTHGGEISWRNIYARAIPTEEANKMLLEKAEGKFVDLFDGKSLTGWQGSVADFEVKDAAIVCKPGKGGQLYTEKEYANFVAQVEFKVPAGGNNGLAIRYPGKGDPAYTGMCEVQILDDTSPKYAKLDPRQYCGSVYGAIPVHRGYLRAVGEWNVIQTTVNGSKIQVEINGFRVTDGDLSTVKEFMGKTPHTGATATKGYFGFAGHSDPVAFRTVRIQELK